MKEPGPFVCIGSMDDGDGRCLKFCAEHPADCSAVVPVSFGGPTEFEGMGRYYNYSASETRAKVRDQIYCHVYTICQTRAANNTKEVYLSRRVRDFFSAAPCCLLAGGRPVQARETWAGRRNLGNLINFFAVSWGLMPLAITTVTTLISPLLFDRLRPHYYTLKNCNSE